MKTLYYNAAVYTGSLPLQSAFLVEGGRFVHVGADALTLPRDEAVDLQGAFVAPGFIDSHMHLLNYGQTLGMAHLWEHTSSKADLLRCLAAQAPSRGGWILGRGWNQDFFTDDNTMPTRRDLDSVSRVSPICIIRACGHALSVNTRALEILGITAATPQPEGGEIVLEDGVPNGVFLDMAMELVTTAIPNPSLEEMKDMLRLGCQALNAQGVTGIHSDDYGTFRALPWSTVDQAYRELEQTGELTVRVYEQCNFPELSQLRQFLQAGNVTGRGSSFYRTGPLKLVADGALGARTALLTRPYADAPGNHGLALLNQDQLDRLVALAHAGGMQVAIHAIGDACLDMVLDSIEKAQRACPRPDARHGIVHCQITRPDQLERIADLGLHVYAQTIFLDYDIHIVTQRVGEALAASSYSWKTLLDRGVTVSNGTDCPVENPRALAGIQCAVTRQDVAATVPPYLPQEAFTVREALDSYTQAGAWASFQENSLGRIAPGMLADFVVLGENPFTAEPHSLHAIPILATYVGGRQVYGK